jgi:hypothetical protein
MATCKQHRRMTILEPLQMVSIRRQSDRRPANRSTNDSTNTVKKEKRPHGRRKAADRTRAGVAWRLSPTPLPPECCSIVTVMVDSESTAENQLKKTTGPLILHVQAQSLPLDQTRSRPETMAALLKKDNGLGVLVPQLLAPAAPAATKRTDRPTDRHRDGLSDAPCR